MSREPEEGKYSMQSASDRFRSQTQPRQIQTNSSICSSISSVKCTSISTRSSASLPPSALRKGKFDVSGRAQIRPLLDLSIIYDLFGENATLYHVLGIEPWTEAADIKRAYLRQGRATLVHGGFAFTAENAPQNLDDFPQLARKEFQAISIAYEILSNPELRSDYDCHGVVHVQSSTSRTNASESSSQNSVRWKPYVEEKVIIDSHPDEHSRRAVIIEAPKEQHKEYGWLESHLRGIDKEAEKFLRGDMLDSFDEGITSLKKSLESLIGNIGSIDSPLGTDVATAVEPNEDNAVSAVIESEPNKQNQTNFMKKLGAKINLFHEEDQITVDSYQQDNMTEKEKSSALHSPCSVTMFGRYMEDMTDSTVRACGLSDSFYNLLG
mmetsp:Transcript_11938/g.22110  ORF Transcript_11938/g.22110 Transcript_11938/m.22110 type:complete len:381 (-) Transcript_11938:121-1263(-)|eukprot:CAMPEP_0201891154 /NCGR_PEP_ID=MMETSP0902-20130614/33797_1 /ASSEMBLY_ACC=CAM_ASM_000551 /TAXON_ID=420261 /ORGANISM="Thalassiosira antarctica, Strain CCMP982" /LENGTH=380 /DNA_ID=CAMNT_0048422251 /DNA_START=27 /DNA_END=1169 /DNA_ORIENTATION=+